MREILFKAKRVDNGEWVEGSYLCRHGRHGIVNQNPSHMEYAFQVIPETVCQVIPETVCQFTGLTDKNGNKIFEGDKVHYRNSTKYCEVTGDYLTFEGVIEYWVGQIGVGYRYKSGRHTMMIKIGQSFSFEVIGNIHD